MYVTVLSGLDAIGQLAEWKIICIVEGLRGNLAQHFDFTLTCHQVLETKNHCLLLCYCDENVSITEVQWSTELTLREGCISACLKYIVWDCKAFTDLLIFENEEHPLKILLSACCIKRVCLSVQFGSIPGALDSTLSSPEDANKPLLNLEYHGCCLRDLANGWLIK